MGTKYASYYDENFFPDVFKLTLMTFKLFFSTINFSHQYLPETKSYL